MGKGCVTATKYFLFLLNFLFFVSVSPVTETDRPHTTHLTLTLTLVKAGDDHDPHVCVCVCVFSSSVVLSSWDLDSGSSWTIRASSWFSVRFIFGFLAPVMPVSWPSRLSTLNSHVCVSVLPPSSTSLKLPHCTVCLIQLQQVFSNDDSACKSEVKILSAAMFCLVKTPTQFNLTSCLQN